MSVDQQNAREPADTVSASLHPFDPKPGDGATIAFAYSRDAGTVLSVQVMSGYCYVVVQEDVAIRTESSFAPELQTYMYSRDTQGRKTMFRRKVSTPPTRPDAWKNCWRDPDSPTWRHSNEPRVVFGYRRKYAHGD